ncbi:MAG: hypothetical protein WBF99_15510 [Xanthobacteraceae bacterium]
MTIARAGLCRSGTDLFTPDGYPANEVNFTAVFGRQLAKVK